MSCFPQWSLIPHCSFHWARLAPHLTERHLYLPRTPSYCWRPIGACSAVTSNTEPCYYGYYWCYSWDSLAKCSLCQYLEHHVTCFQSQKTHYLICKQRMRSLHWRCLGTSPQTLCCFGCLSSLLPWFWNETWLREEECSCHGIEVYFNPNPNHIEVSVDLGEHCY